jgi:hypothetical protein
MLLQVFSDKPQTLRRVTGMAMERNATPETGLTLSAPGQKQHLIVHQPSSSSILGYECRLATILLFLNVQ